MHCYATKIVFNINIELKSNSNSDFMQNDVI